MLICGTASNTMKKARIKKSPYMGLFVFEEELKERNMTERSRRYEARHPELTYYTSKKRSAKSFVACSTEKFFEAVDHVGRDRYRSDLLELRDMIEEKLNEI